MTRDKNKIKRYSKNTSKKILAVLGFLLVFFILAGIFIVPKLGQWLVFEDELQESDLIVVLMGSMYDRILESVDLYGEGYSDRIVMVKSYRAAKDIIIDRGIKVYENALLNKMAAMDLGIPEEDVIVLDGNSRSTQDEAMTIREYVRNNKEIKSIILVTSKFHSGRAKKIFEKALSVLDREIVIYCSPSKYDPSNVNQWWRNREDFQWVVFQYLKLANFYFWEQFLLD